MSKIEMMKEAARKSQEEADRYRELVGELQEFAIWMTGCGFDFAGLPYFCEQRDKLLLDKKESNSTVEPVTAFEKHVMHEQLADMAQDSLLAGLAINPPGTDKGEVRRFRRYEDGQTPDSAYDLPPLTYKIANHKRGYRAQIFNGDDMIFQFLNYHDTEEEAAEAVNKVWYRKLVKQ